MPWNNQGSGQDGGQKPPGSGGPWGNSGGGNNRPPNPPGGSPPPPGGPKGPGGLGGGRPPELDELLRRGHFHFRQMFAGGPAQQNVAAIIFAIVCTLWLLSGFYRVQPDEQAIPKTFGKASENIVGPGLHYIWPTPIGSVVISRTGTENRTEVPAPGESNGLRGESLMLTGDENIIDIKFVVRWKINDPFKYEFNIRDQKQTISRAAESAIREVVGQTPIQTALTEGREEVASRTQVLLQKMLDEYQAGITIDGIDLTDVSPPEPVRDAFNDVQRALSDQERARNDAEAYRNSVLPRAQGEAARKRQDAIGYQAEVVNRATGDADRFKAVEQAYAQAKDVTQKRLYLETMEEILSNAKKIVTDTASGTPVILPYNAIAPAPAAPAGGTTDAK
jgi:membrane protease subunit HflK